LCDKSYHRACLKKLTPPYKNNDINWSCQTCSKKNNSITNLNIKLSSVGKLPRGIKIGQANVRDLLSKNKKYDVYEIIKYHSFDIFIITETWLKPEILDSEIDIPGYFVVRVDRPGFKTGGGVLIYLKEEWNVVEQSIPFLEPVDSVFVKLKRDHLPHINLFVIYRPNSTPPTFIDQLEEIFVKYMNEETYLIGDYNLNQLSTDNNQCHKLRALITKYNFKQLINKATRVTSTTETLLDLMITNSPHLVVASGVWKSYLADHEITYLVRKKSKLIKDPAKYKYIRNFKNVNNDKLRKSFEEAPWWALDICRDVNKSYAMFCYIITQILDFHAPFKKVRVLSKKPSWWTTEYSNLNKQCLTMKKRVKKGCNPGEELQYKTLRNHINQLKTKLHAQSIQEQISNSDNTPKEAWKVFNSELGRKKSSSEIKCLNINGTVTYDKQIILNQLAKEFVKIPLDHDKSESDISFSTTTEDDEFRLEQITTEQVLTAIKKIKSNKPSGFDMIPCHVYKDFCDILAPIIAKLFTRSLQENTFPELMKMSIIRPLYKNKGSKSDMTNYRAIAIIPIIAKIFEIIVCNKLCDYLDKIKYFNASQHGFRKDHSTLSAVMTLVNEILENADEKNYTGVIYLDYTNAFNFVNHNMLLNKLKNAGLSVNLLQWFNTYLKKRKIIVREGEITSKTYGTVAGVPAGSNLSPLLYGIFCNDLPDIFNNDNNNCSVGSYADDVRALVKAKTENELVRKLNCTVEKLCNGVMKI
jgi:hypothetical protein